MTREPAAAVRTRSGLETRDLHDRLRELLRRSTGDDGNRLADRLLPALSDSFYWLLIPKWLAERFGLTSTPKGRGLLEELCWIQYCVYALFRLQDDLIDGDADDPTVAVTTNHLLVEASGCAARQFGGGSPFWSIFQGTIDATSRTMVRLDRLQRTPDRPPGIERKLYAELSACLKIASAGVALATGREHEWSARISPALDRLAVAMQILDDLTDLSDDLRSGRINYAAWYLGRPVFGSSLEATEAVVASNLATTDRLWGLLGEVLEELDEATRGLGRDLCPRTHDFLREYRAGVVGLGERIQGSRMAVLGIEAVA